MATQRWLEGSIETARALRDFAEKAGVQLDWHEPDVTAEVVGRVLDNASGDFGEADPAQQIDKIVVLTDEDGHQLTVNLATVLALAAQLAREYEPRRELASSVVLYYGGYKTLDMNGNTTRIEITKVIRAAVGCTLATALRTVRDASKVLPSTIVCTSPAVAAQLVRDLRDLGDADAKLQSEVRS